MEELPTRESFKVSGRGELHLSILIETMRREGYELAVSRPQVITREENGRITEPYELVTADIEEGHQGKVMETLGERRGELEEMIPDGHGRVRLRFRIPTRGLMGYRPVFLSITSGTGILSYASAGYGPRTEAEVGQRSSGVLVFNERIYHRDLPPSMSAGGTVDYVGPEDQDFISRIEEREKAGTPGVLQILRAALAFELKEGPSRIC